MKKKKQEKSKATRFRVHLYKPQMHVPEPFEGTEFDIWIGGVACLRLDSGARVWISGTWTVEEILETPAS